MSSSRVQAPPVNLKERIAALQQRTNATTSTTSPSPSTPNISSQTVPLPPTGHSSSNTTSNLREKIARFEKKGGVPVPRGSFGLGAPPPTDGHPRRQGELYGNRIPQPLRVVSGPAHAPGSGSSAHQRAQSPLGMGAAGDKRRSFSLSNVNVMMSSDYSESGVGTPLTSPSLSSPPSSPGFAPDMVAMDGIPRIPTIPSPPSTFATALEFARSVEKATLHDSVSIPVLPDEAVDQHEHLHELHHQSPPAPPLPAIVVSLGEDDILAESMGLPSVEEEEAHVAAIEETDRETTLTARDDDAPSPHQDSLDHHCEEAAPVIPDLPATLVPPSPDKTTISQVDDVPQDSSLSPLFSTPTDLNTSPAPPPVSSTHKILLRAAGLGSPPTDAVQQRTPGITSELVLSDVEGSGTTFSPIVGIALESPEPHSGVATSLAQVAEEVSQMKDTAEIEVEADPDIRPETKVEVRSKRPSPPALALEMDDVTVTPSPTVDSEAIQSSQHQRDAEEDSEKAIQNVQQPFINTESSPSNAAAVDDKPPSSPTTPHAPHAPLPNTQDFTPSYPPTPSSLAPPQSLNGTPVRPVSMIEFSPSPSHVEFAHRVTPPTSRGVPVFFPSTDPVSANGLTRKSDLVYYPPTPPDKKFEFEIDYQGENLRVPRKEEEGERGSVTIIHQRSDSAMRQTSSAFRAVVHNKIREIPPVINHGPLVPQTPQIRRTASALPLTNDTPITYNSSGLPVIPPSPGFTELADLLQSTVLLEQTLEKGALPTEPTTLSSGVPSTINNDDYGDISREIVTRRADGVEVRRLSRDEAEENKRTLAKLQAKREEQAKSKIRSTFRNTLARAKEVAGVGGGAGMTTSVYVDGSGSAVASQHQHQQQQPQQQFYSKRFKSPSVPYLLDSVPGGGSAGAPDGLLRSKTPENQIGTAKPASLTSKSPKSRFPSFRRLASSSKSSSSSKEGYGHGHTRNSVSTSSEISSEDSAPTAVTPPDLASEFGESVKGGSTGGGLPWPSVSPSKKGKDGTSNIARAATFAGKMWQRARTKSGASTLSVHSSVGRMSSEFPPALPPLPNIVVPLGDSQNKDAFIQPPARTTSLNPRLPQPPESPALPPLPPKSPDISLSLSFDLEESRSSTPVQQFNHFSLDAPSSQYTPHVRRRMDTTPPSNMGSIRPVSWVSVSSANSNPNSSLLDSELFDAFPSVPENHPLVLPPNSYSYPYSQPRSTPSPPSSASSSPSLPFLPSPKRGAQGTGMIQSFDAGLLSSATHLTAGVPSDGAFLAPNSASSEGFLPLVSPYSPPEHAQNTGRVFLSHVNMNGRNGVPPSR